jgi:hypothetical protein
VWFEHVRAPLVIFPLLVGCMLGLLLVTVVRFAGIGHLPTLAAGAVLAALAAAGGQHYFSYRDYLDARGAFLARKGESSLAGAFLQAAPAATPGFCDYMCGQAKLGRPITTGYSLRDAAAWASWTLDGILLTAATVAIVYFTNRAPYCATCRSWYKSIRSGRVDGEVVTRLANAATLLIARPGTAARYRLSHCASGCGLARLQLSWNDAHGRAQRAEAWLAAGNRDAVGKVLDAATEEGSP